MRANVCSLLTLTLFAIVVGGFGTAFALNSLAVSALPPLWVATVRATVACGLFLLLALMTKRAIPLRADDIRTYFTIGMTTGVAPFFLLAWGQARVSSSLAAVLFASVPLTTVFIGWYFFAEPAPTKRKVFGTSLGLVGVLLAFPIAMAASNSFVFGASAILASAISYAFGGLFLKRAVAYDPIALMAGQFLASAVILVAMAIVLAGPLPQLEMDIAYFSAILVGVTGTTLPLASFLFLLRRTDAVAASTVTFFVPFIAIAVGVLALQEDVSPRLFVGLAVCLTGSGLVSRAR
ncbi:MAG: DMT family transporter [Pseudomonadota bacterium]